ncbi:PE family protein, partial [Mycobacterium szulgai]
MSFLYTIPDQLTVVAADLAGIGSSIRTATTAAGTPTTAVLAAGADEVSNAVAALFGRHGQAYQALSAEASAFHDRFVQTLHAGAGTYLQAEAASAATNLLDAINAPTLQLFGRPLIGNGANAPAGSGGNGHDGGLLWGDGGAGGSGSMPGQNGGNGGAAGLFGNGGPGGSGNPGGLGIAS